MQYSFYVNQGLFSESRVFKYVPQNLDVKQLSSANGREIKEVFGLPYTPSSRIKGMMTKEQVGHLVERLYGRGGLSVSVVCDGEVIMTRRNGRQNGNGRKRAH